MRLMGPEEDEDNFLVWIEDRPKRGSFGYRAWVATWRPEELRSALRAAELRPESREIIETRAELRDALDLMERTAA